MSIKHSRDHFWGDCTNYKRRSKGEPLGDQEWKKKPENREPVQPTMSSLAQRFQRRQTEQNKARYGHQSCRIAAHEEARTTTTKTDDWPPFAPPFGLFLLRP